MNPPHEILGYEDWPLKVIYATRGIQRKNLLKHMNEYYAENSGIPWTRRPNFIHVLGKYVLIRGAESLNLQNLSTQESLEFPGDQYFLYAEDSDLPAFVFMLDLIQRRTIASSHIRFTYGDFLNNALRSKSKYRE